jgi:hypothetical protein
MEYLQIAPRHQYCQVIEWIANGFANLNIIILDLPHLIPSKASVFDTLEFSRAIDIARPLESLVNDSLNIIITIPGFSGVVLTSKTLKLSEPSKYLAQLSCLLKVCHGISTRGSRAQTDLSC